MKYKLYFLISIVYIWPHLQSQGQLPCKPKLRANRHKHIQCDSVSFAGFIYDYNGDKIEQCILPNGLDSVTVNSGGHIPVVLHAKGGAIIDNFIQYRNKYEWLRDSVIPYRNCANHGYYGIFYNSHVVFTINESQTWQLWYNRNGEDSCYIQFHENKVPKHMELYGQYNWVLESKDWNREGILQMIVTNGIELEYHGNGILHAAKVDTVIEDHFISCHRAYYESGILKSVTFFDGDTPCHIWCYYDKEGILEKKVQFIPISSLPPTMRDVAPPKIKDVFVNVFQKAEYPSGNPGLIHYLNIHLPEVLCAADEKLSGDYKVLVKINLIDGHMHLLSVSGANANAFKNLIQSMLNMALPWKIAKIDGAPADQKIEFHISVK